LRSDLVRLLFFDEERKPNFKTSSNAARIEFNPGYSILWLVKPYNESKPSVWVERCPWNF
jgi:hypothetical protein